MKKIGLVYLGKRGGGPVYAYEMAKGLIENGYELYLFISSYVENKEKWLSLDAKSIEVIDTFHSIKEYIIRTISFRMHDYKNLCKKYSSVSLDACYIPMGHVWDDYFINILRCANLIYTDHDPISHSSDQTISRRLSILGTKLLNIGIKKRKPDNVVVLSEVFREIAQDKFELSREKVHVIPHGIFDFYKSVDNGSIHNYSPDKVNFLFWGRIEGYKGVDDLAKAYQILRAKYNNVSLTIVGSGDFSPYIELFQDLEDVEIVNRWILDSEVASYFKSSAKLILVLPYKDASQSGVIPTAMSFSIPIIATNTGGLSEQIKDGVTGYLCEPCNPVSLAECMERVMFADTRAIVSNAFEYVNSLDWYSLSKKIGGLV